VRAALCCALILSPDAVGAWSGPPPMLPCLRAPRAALPAVVHRRSSCAIAMKRESWMESDSTTIMGRSRTPAVDAGADEDDYTVMDLEVITRATRDLKARRAALDHGGEGAADSASAEAAELACAAFREQTARRLQAAERLFVAALEADRKCGAAWFGLGSLLHECQHGGLVHDEERERHLSQAADAALIAARFEAQHPRALALLGDILNDLGNHREACRAWNAAEARGRKHWRMQSAAWLGGGGAFGPREPLKSLKIDDEPVVLQRPSGRAFTAKRVSDVPHAFVLSGFSTEEERHAIIAAGVDAPMRAVPRSDDGDPDDERSGCEVAWLASPITEPASAWATLMTDAANLVLPPDAQGLPAAGPAEDLHVVKYATAGAYGLHLDATFAVPRAVTVLHYLNDVPPSDKGPGFGGETWLPQARSRDRPAPGSEKPVPGQDGVLVPPRAGDALVFFSFDDVGNVEPASIHGGRPTSSLKWIANQVRSCLLLAFVYCGVRAQSHRTTRTRAHSSAIVARACAP